MVCPISKGTGDHMRLRFDAALTGTPIKTVVPGTDYCARIPRPTYDQTSAAPHVISVGALKARKGFEVSLQAFRILKERIPNARYTIVGSLTDEAYVSKLRAFIAQTGLQDVEFTGEVGDDELPKYYRAASVFLLTPQQVGLATEGFGLVYIEAGAYGLPVVGTRVGGVADAVLAGRTGFLHEPSDAGGIADSLTRLLTDRALARSMGAENRAWAEQLTWERCAAAYADVYQTITAYTRPNGAPQAVVSG
jgi:phosphatidylinositol alpha-1,6-mannosyltransferase